MHALAAALDHVLVTVQVLVNHNAHHAMDAVHAEVVIIPVV